MQYLKPIALGLALLSGPALADLFPPPQQATVCGQDSAAERAYVECSRARGAAAREKTTLSPDAQTQCTAADALWASHITTLAACPAPAPENN